MRKNLIKNYIVCHAKSMSKIKQTQCFREAQQRPSLNTTWLPGMRQLGTRMPRIDNRLMNRKPAEPVPTKTWHLTPTYNF